MDVCFYEKKEKQNLHEKHLKIEYKKYDGPNVSWDCL